MNYNIYLDLDGVFANLEKKLSEILNKPMESLTKDDWNDSLRKYTKPDSKINLFLDLEIMPWSKQFYLLMLGLNKREDINISFLTSISADKTNKRRVIAEKQLWIIRNFGDDFNVLFSDSWKDKHCYIIDSENNKNILIDDFILQKDVWEKNGGIFIHHRGSLEQSYKQLINLI